MPVQIVLTLLLVPIFACTSGFHDAYHSANPAWVVMPHPALNGDVVELMAWLDRPR